MLPQSPGVYQFVDRSGTIIYVGKAKSLRKRVSSYFVQSKEHSPKVRVLVKQIAEIRHIVVDSETDALLLENSLIKTLQPRYNILHHHRSVGAEVLRPVAVQLPRRLHARKMLAAHHDPRIGLIVFEQDIVLRPLRIGDDAAQRAGFHPRGGSLAYLQTQSRSRADRQGKIYGLPAIPPGQLQRPLHRGAGRRGIRPARRHGRRGAQGRPAPRA